MFRNFKTIRSFYKLSKVKPTLIFLMFLTLIIPVMLSVWTPILVSNTITAITVYDFKKAMSQTIIEFIIVLLSAVLYFLYHLISNKVNRIIVINYQNYIYYNVKNNQEIKSVNISLLKDISTCVEFNKNLIHKFCFFLKALVILGIILYYSYILALSIVIVSIITFLLLKITDKKIQFKTKTLSQDENISLNLFNSICSGDSVEQSYNLELALKDKYFQYVHKNIKTSNSISLYYNINNNFISLILKSAVFLSTIFLIGEVRSTELTLSVYLILTPYLTSSAENLISFFDVFSEIALMDNILNHFESLKYIQTPAEEKPIQIDTFNLYFYNLTTSNKLKLKESNLKINYKDAVCFVGDEDYKIQEIFDIISKKEKPANGCVLLGDKNISDLSEQNYNKFVASVSPDDKFFSISIYENFYLVCESRTKIFKEIKTLGLSKFINSFEEKYNTILHDLSSKQRFLLGLARAYLSGAKIINIYKIPDNLPVSDKLLIKQTIKNINKKCTIICYFNDEQFKELFDYIYVIENNGKNLHKLSKIANNNNRN